MTSPKPVTLTQIATASYVGPDPEPLTVVGALPIKSQVAALTAITTPDATDPATTMALANINKAKINAIIAALKA